MTEASAPRNNPAARQDNPKRGVSPLLLLMALCGAGIALVAARELPAYWHERAQRIPPRTQRLIAAASMEPVDVALHATGLLQTTEQGIEPLAPADLRAAFRVPAAYVAHASDGKGPGGRGSLTLRLWSGTFDPVRPDELADLALCSAEERLRGCPRLGPDGGRFEARRRAGEYALTVEVTHVAGAEQYQRYVMGLQSGTGGGRASGRQPCDTREDAALGLLVSRTPEGIRPSEACNFHSDSARHRSGRVLRPASFLKLEADGSPRFSVKCSMYVDAAAGVPPFACRMVGYHGPWPVIASVRSDRAAEWAETFDRLRDFLTRHTAAAKGWDASIGRND